MTRRHLRADRYRVAVDLLRWTARAEHHLAQQNKLTDRLLLRRVLDELLTLGPLLVGARAISSYLLSLNWLAQTGVNGLVRIRCCASFR